MVCPSEASLICLGPELPRFGQEFRGKAPGPLFRVGRGLLVLQTHGMPDGTGHLPGEVQRPLFRPLFSSTSFRDP
jgi:hypothetical protein